MTAPARGYVGLGEGVARRVETPRWHAVYRLAIGFHLVPLFSWWHGEIGSDWRLFPFFLVVLLTLRLVPALVRHVVSFSADLQSQWAHQRFLAKRFDSYQWRKLLWFGLGLAAYLPFLARPRVVPMLLALFCLLAGGLGAVTWHRTTRTTQMVGVGAMGFSRPE